MRNHDNNNHVIANLLKASAAISIGIFLVACGDDSNKTSGGSVEDQEVIAITDKTISGVSQKGPFVNGSSVTVQELDGETLAQTGNSYEGKIKNDMGEFSVKVTKLASQYALLKANGFYSNEVTGEKSKSQVTLYALTDISNRDEVNVNLLTHLEYERSLYLAADDSVTVAAAKKQAEKEVLAAFGITGDFANTEDLNIFGTDDGAAALLAVSVLMQGDLSEADFSERLADYAADIETDGMWGDSKTATKIADWASSKSLGADLENIRNNIAKWDISTDVPAFEKYVDNFWWQNYGLGTCDKKRNGEILQNTNKQSETYKTYFICDNNAWRLASVLEYDTYKWIDPTRRDTTKDAAVRYGDVIKTNCYVFEDKKWRSGNENDCSLNLRGCTALRQDTVGKGSDNVWHICDSKSWRDATTYEKDTFGWKDSTDGAIKKGNVTDTVYVFDKTAWRVTSNVEAKLGGCVSTIADSVGRVGSTYYICKSNKWVEASAIEYDTYRWVAGKDGDSKTGSVDAKNCYVYEENVWRSGNTSDCSLGLRGCTALRQDMVGKGRDNVWYKCDSQTWRTATNIEKDTATWGVGEFDGEIRTGQINETIYYIYETNTKTWRNATALEYDTYQMICSEDGKMFNGNVNTMTKYVCDNGIFRMANEIEVAADSACTSYNINDYHVLPRVNGNRNYSYYKCTENGWSFTTEKLNQGTMTDLRDGHVYKIIGVKTQMWMAENLNYADSVNYPSMLGKNWCMNDADSCAKYGRYYTWSAAIDSVYWAKQGKYCGVGFEDTCGLPQKVRGVCLEGWSMPNEQDWNILLMAVENDVTFLQAKGFSFWKKAADEYGFTALPAGRYYAHDEIIGNNLNNGDPMAYFWTSTERNNSFGGVEEYGNEAMFFDISKNSAHIGSYYKFDGFSVRCIKDEE